VSQEVVEARDSVNLSNLLASDQLFVNVLNKEVYVFAELEGALGIEKHVSGAAAYAEIFGKTKITASGAMLCIWHKYHLETQVYDDNGHSFILLFVRKSFSHPN
jgi:hypothetical protein